MQTVIAAVSGGVDSVVMLDRLIKHMASIVTGTGAPRRLQGQISPQIIIAHVDHGIRPESAEDAEFVRQLAEKYALPYESTELRLGAGASEALARTKRWEFLRAMREKYNADVIATAHHADDVVETMIINLIRGTGWRGLVSLRESESIKRPLINIRKKDITAYAESHGLQWREDPTNQDTIYLRNYVRHNVVAGCSDEVFARFLALYRDTLELREEIEQELDKLENNLLRYQLIMWPDEVAAEVLRMSLGALPRAELARALLFARTTRPYKVIPLSNGLKLKSDVKQLIVQDTLT